MPESTPYICYRCHRPVSRADLIAVDEEIESLDESLAPLVFEEFVHCVGESAMFHGDGIVNCCPRCLKELIAHQEPPFVRELYCPDCEE